MSKKSTWKHKLAAVLVSCFMIIVVLLLGEAFCRLFTRINFLDNSRDLFTVDRYGRPFGNTPNFSGISFGETFHTDAEGFRADPEFKSQAPADSPAILLVGDSVTFGTGVKDSETFAEHLRHYMSDRRVYNAGVVGYDTFDYKSLTETLVKQKPEIKTVLVFYCLNDISDASAQQIKHQTTTGVPQERGSATLIQNINDFLRSRSKLYLAVKNMLQDTQLLYFQGDLASYQKDENVTFGLQQLVELKKTLDASGIRLKVFMLPYEAQLRANAGEGAMLPQQKIGDFLRANKVDFYDTAADFKNTGWPNRLFLFGDPMHLSREGHKVAADTVCNNLGEQCALK